MIAYSRMLVAVAIATACAVQALAQPSAVPAPGTRTIYLVRHGIYDRDENADDVTGNGLNALGREQAAFVGARFDKLPVRIASLVSSNYLRAVETADVMGQVMGLPPARDSLLHECTPYSSRADIMKGAAPGEADSAEAQLSRAWSKYVRPAGGAADEHVVLVAHGNVIRWFTCRALGVDTKQWGSMDIGNASITAMVVRPDGVVRLVMFSDVGHLPVEKQTWSGKGPGWGPPKK